MVSHAVDLLSKCARFRDQGEFIDVHLKVREDIFPAHRIVLAANSDYFHAMFTDEMKSNQEVIELKDESISPDALKIVMDSIYTGDLNVDGENVFEVLAAADYLQVTSVVQQCCDFLKREFIQLRLDLHNYCLLSTVADRHGLRDLQEAAEKKMASMFKDICESEEFLTHIGTDQLFSLLSRDDLSAPSETFVFKSVMQWIKHKKEERMRVAAKVIGAVRLGLVDIRVVIQELNTEQMQQDPEIRMLLQESLLHNNMPSCNSAFAVEKSKPRSTSPALIAVTADEQMQYFDVEAKTWKPLASTIPPLQSPWGDWGDCAVSVGSRLFVAGSDISTGCFIDSYDTERNEWETLHHSCGVINNLCVIDDHMYAISTNPNQIPQRYSFAKRQWQSIAKIDTVGSNYWNGSKGAIVCSKLFVLHEDRAKLTSGDCSPAVLTCFDPEKNEWEVKATTCQPHFGSILIVVNNTLYVAGGHLSIPLTREKTFGNPAPVERYNEESNNWSVVEQKRIPPNNLGAVEIEGRVYFIINNFPIDSGIRIPPGELYPVHLGEWENLAKIDKRAVLCYFLVKRESLNTE